MKPNLKQFTYHPVLKLSTENHSHNFFVKFREINLHLYMLHRENCRTLFSPIFWLKFREINAFSDKSYLLLLSRNIFLSEITLQCGNYGNSLSSRIFDKNFVKVTVLQNKLCTKELIWRNMFWWERISSFFTLCTLHNTAWKFNKFSIYHSDFSWNQFWEC